MIRLPASLERRLKQLFPRQRERDKFVSDLVEKAMENQTDIEEDTPMAIGGTLHLFTDGGSRGNPGQAAIAAIIEDPSTGGGCPGALRVHRSRNE